MKKNYHTHTVLCNHATGSVEEYVATAVEKGLTVLGFSDHVPYPYKSGHVSKYRMGTDQVDTYVDRIEAAEEKFRDRIRLHIGYEAEFYPENFEAMLRCVSKRRVEYLIMGQHYIGEEEDGISVFPIIREEELLKAYVDQVIRGMETEQFTYIAHPDVVDYLGDPAVFEKHMMRLIRRAEELDMGLEFNLLGFREKRHYPREQFWQMVGAEGSRVKTILGCDAHRVIDVGDQELAAKAVEYLASLGITPTEEIEFRPVKPV